MAAAFSGDGAGGGGSLRARAICDKRSDEWKSANEASVGRIVSYARRWHV